jgi:hypothetical protein
MSHTTNCESCGMPIEAGPYCAHCVDADGKLQGFDVRFARMVDWQLRKNPGMPRDRAERETLQHMATLPAWRDHPRVRSRAAGRPLG